MDGLLCRKVTKTQRSTLSSRLRVFWDNKKVASETVRLEKSPDVMQDLSTRPDPPASAQGVVNIVSDDALLATIPVEHLQHDFQIRHYTPQEVIRHAAHEQEQMMAGRVATLVNWDERGPVVLSVLKEAAHRHAVPLVVLCGRNRAEHVAALVVGGDDVLMHPVNPIMLQARLVAYQRRIGYPNEPSAHTGDGLLPPDPPEITTSLLEAHDVQVIGPLVLDRTARQFYIHGHLEPLPARTFDLMAFLMEHAGECQARGVLLDVIWGIDFETGTNILDVQIYRLRGRMKKHGVAAMIETVRGIGYRLRGVRGS